MITKRFYNILHEIVSARTGMPDVYFIKFCTLPIMPSVVAASCNSGTVSGCHNTELVNCGGSYGDEEDVCNCCRCVLNHLPFAAAFLQRSVLSAVSLLTETSSLAIAYLFMIFSKNVQVCEYRVSVDSVLAMSPQEIDAWI